MKGSSGEPVADQPRTDQGVPVESRTSPT
jgi:hypothetical protein